MAAPHETPIVLREIGTEVGDSREPIIRGLETPFIATGTEYRDGSRGGTGGGAGGGGTPEVFTPLVAEDFSSYTVGSNYSQGTWKANRCPIDDTRAFAGDRSMKIMIDAGGPPLTCGGEGYYGGRVALPITVPIGKRIWYRLRAYFPSAFSWGYVYSSSDTEEMQACSLSSVNDGNGALKFMRLAPDNTLSRLYLLPQVQRRNVAQPTNGNVVTLAAEAGPSGNGASSNPAGRFALDAWNAIQIEVLVSNTGTGYIRYWLGDEFIHEVTDISTVSASDTGMAEWAIGTHFNGIQFTDGEPGRSEFWVDDIIIATDADGYGSPTGIDSNGNNFIAPTTLAGDLV